MSVLYLMRVLIVVIMGRCSEFSSCIVCQVVRLHNVVEIVAMSGETACCSVVCDTLVVVNLFSVFLERLQAYLSIHHPINNVLDFLNLESPREHMKLIKTTFFIGIINKDDNRIIQQYHKPLYSTCTLFIE